MAIRLTSSGLEGMTHVDGGSSGYDSPHAPSAPSVGGIVSQEKSSGSGAVNARLPSSGSYIVISAFKAAFVSGGTTRPTYTAIRNS